MKTVEFGINKPYPTVICIYQLLKTGLYHIFGKA